MSDLENNTDTIYPVYAINTICDKIKKQEPICCKEKYRPLKKEEYCGVLKSTITLDDFYITDTGWKLLEIDGEIVISGKIIQNMPIIGLHINIVTKVGLGAIALIPKATTSFKSGYSSIGPIKKSEDHVYWMVLPTHIVKKNEINIKSWSW